MRICAGELAGIKGDPALPFCTHALSNPAGELKLRNYGERLC